MPGLSDHFTASRAYLVGIESYSNARLYTPIKDVTGMADVLLQHEFLAANIRVKTDIDKTGFEQLIRQMQEECKPGDRVLLYFAGHGIAHESYDEPKGYLLPVNADKRDEATFIDMKWMMEEIFKIPSRHFLLILDCCFSGAVRWAEGYRSIVFDDVKKLYKEKFHRFVEDASWQVITSSSYNEEALDQLTRIGFRDNAQQTLYKDNSPFAKILIDLLHATEEDHHFPDGIITATRLYDAIDERMAAYLLTNGVEHQQSPSYFLLRKHKKGQFIFIQPAKKDRAIDTLPKRETKNPYRGLLSYRLQDDYLFFGRSNAIQGLTAIIRSAADRPVVVTGASGIGKSSLIQAGVMPALRSSFSLFVVRRPGQIKSTPDILVETSSMLGNASGDPVVFIDQYEELVTVCNETEKDVWMKFIQETRRLYPSGRIIIGVRNDFEAQMDDVLTGAFPDMVRYVVPVLQRSEIEEIILQPALQAAIEIHSESGDDKANEEFINQIVDEAMQSYGSLPLLSYALQEWYLQSVKEQFGNWVMPERIYHEVGGISGALSKIMTAFVQKLNDEQKQVLRHMLIRMVSVHDGNFTRKKVYQDELDFEDDRKKRIADELLQELIQARIIITNSNTVGDNKERVYYEPAHDALIVSWRQLWTWVNEEGQEKMAVYRRLSEDVERWTVAAGGSRRTILWDTGSDMDTVVKDVNGNARGKIDLFREELVSAVSLGVFPLHHDVGRSYLNKQESSFIRSSLLQIRRRKSILYLSLLTLLSLAIITGLYVNRKNRLNEALFINSTAEGNSPSEKILLLKRAYSLDPSQEVTKDNITRLLNLSPSNLLPFAEQILYHKGSTFRNIIADDATGDCITIADSSMIWWKNNAQDPIRFSDSDVITTAGFMQEEERRVYYLTFSGTFKIFDQNKNWINQKENNSGGSFYRTFQQRVIYYAAYSPLLHGFLLVSAATPASDDIQTMVCSFIDQDGHVKYHDTLNSAPLHTFITYNNEKAHELYFYDTKTLVVYNYRSRSFHTYALVREAKQPDGPVNVSKLSSSANDFPVFHFAADGKSFFYKPFRDSVFFMSITPAGAVTTKMHNDIIDGAFIDDTGSLAIIDSVGVTILDKELSYTTRVKMEHRLVSINTAQNGEILLINDEEGNGYLLNNHLNQQMVIDKSYNYSQAVISSARKKLFLVSRGEAFYVFDLKKTGFLFHGISQSQVVPLFGKQAFATWNDDYDYFEIMHTDGSTDVLQTDSSIITVAPLPSGDSICIFTKKSFTIIDIRCRVLFTKYLPPYILQQNVIPLRGVSRFLLYHDSIIRIVSYDLKQQDSFKLRSPVSAVSPLNNGDFIVLQKNGEIARYNSHFIRKWKFSDPKLAITNFDDKIVYMPPLVYRVNTAGEYISFDTTGRFKTTGTLVRNTSNPGGNFDFGTSLERYLFSPPDLYLNTQQIVYDNVLYDFSGKQLYDYQFNKVVFGQIIDKDRILFQAVNTYEVFTQFTPEGALKQLDSINILIAHADGNTGSR